MNTVDSSVDAETLRRMISRTRAAIVLLLLASAVFVVAVYARTAAAPNFSHAGFWDTVRSELDPVAGLWVLAAVAIGAANALIAVAVLILAGGAKLTGTWRWRRVSVIAAWIALAASAAYVFGYIATVRFESPNLGAEPLFWFAYVAGFVATVAVAVSLTFLALEWRRMGIIRSRALVIVSAVLAVVSIALPPFVVGVLGLVFALVRLRGLATSRRTPSLP